MNKAANEILSETFLDVIENMAFMFGEQAGPAELPDTGGEYILATMLYSGPHGGTLHMAAPADLCRAIAVNTLGLESESSLQLGLDAFKEVLNVTCGNLLTRLSGEQEVYEVTIPETKELDSDEWHLLLSEPDALTFVLEDWPLLLLHKTRE